MKKINNENNKIQFNETKKNNDEKLINNKNVKQRIMQKRCSNNDGNK